MIYNILSILLFVFSFVYWDEYKKESARNGKRKKNYVYILFLIILICFEGLRWEIGTDWDSYYLYFQSGDEIHAGFGYNFLMSVFKKISNNFTAFLLFIATATFVIIGRLFSKYSINSTMSLCLYFCSSMGVLGCNRQILAMLVCLLSLKYIFERKLLPFVALVSIASIIHITALVFLPAYFLYTIKYSPRTVSILVIAAFFIGLSGLVNKIPFVKYLAFLDSVTTNTELAGYVGLNFYGVSIVGSFKRIIFIFLALWVMPRIKNERYNYFLILYVVGGIGYLMFNGSILQMFAGRGMMVYNFFEAMVIPFAIYYLPVDKSFKKMAWSAFFALSFYLMWRDMNSYYIQDGFDIFNPYKSVLF